MTAGSAEDIYLIEIVAYNAGVTTLRYATGRGHVTGPAETPANTFFDPRVVQPVSIRRTMFAPRTTKGRSTVAFGDIELLNGDAAIDALINYGFDGRAITVRRGPVGAAYPGGFTTDLVATMQNIEATQEKAIIKLRDRQAEMDIPLQPTKYAGNNSLPAGLEGVEDLKGKPKPVCFGSVLNLPAPCVNTSKLIYQVNDGAVASIDRVADRGVDLLPTRGNLLIAVGNVSGSSEFIQTSTNGTSWSSTNLGLAGSLGFPVVRYLNGLWLIGSNASPNQIAVSSDATNWTLVNLPGPGGGAVGIYGIAYGNGVYVAVGSGGRAYYSTDTLNWTAAALPISGSGLFSLWFGDGTFVACEPGQSDVAVSNDGKTWQKIAVVANLRCVTWGNGLWVAAGGSGAATPIIYTSPDGIVWTSRTPPGGHVSPNTYRTAFYGNGLYVLAGEGSIVATSSDGITWTARTSATGGQVWRGVAYDTVNTLFVLAGGVSALYVDTSPDAITWTNRVSASAQPPGVTGGATSAVAFGEGGAVVNYANSTDLLDDTKAPAPGKFKSYLAGGYFRLGAMPAGLMAADVTEGATAADRTTAQVYKRLLTRAGKSSGDWVAGDFTTLDAAFAAVIGYWTDQEATYAAVFDQVAESAGAAWYIDRANLFRIKQLLAPTGSPVVALTASDLLKPLIHIQPNDPAQGIPAYQCIVRYARNYITQSSDVALSVTAARRGVLSKEWREVSATDAAVQTAHLLAPQIVENSLLLSQSDAQTEATRRQALRGTQRHMYEVVVPLTNENAAVDIADVLTLQHSRYGLGAGVLMRVLGVAIDGGRRELTWTLWH